MELTKQHQVALGTSRINAFRHSKRFPDASFNSIVSPNVDTLYSIAHLDLQGQPLVMTIPDTRGRYFMMPIMDAWSNVVASPGTRTLGSGAQTLLIVGPDWQGQTPQGMQLIRVPTRMGWIIGRIKTHGPSDYEQVHRLQDQFVLTPLDSRFGHKAYQAIAIPELDTHTAPDRQLAGWSSDSFFTRACRLLRDNPGRSDDAAILRRIREAGLLAQDCSTPQSPLQRLGSEIGYRLAVRKLGESQQLLAERKTYNGWNIGYGLGEYGVRYGQRAMVAKIGFGANTADDAIYPNLHQDSDGRPLNGARRYILHFPAEQLPPVKGFWSLTLYNDRQALSANELDRYALGDRDPLQFNRDGSLDLYIQHERPVDPQHVANWLPAPADGFNLFLRLYWPEPQVLDGRWLPPPIEVAESTVGEG
ncbi:DUF1254 domain-containing protein [Pseudomonas sp. NPDC086566]|uniref:DUF1254 domain-containing protein n=1 Tax=Pseudomonas sp. NPDC086566 TaxID=3390647 RepID=UPI003D02F608